MLFFIFLLNNKKKTESFFTITKVLIYFLIKRNE